MEKMLYDGMNEKEKIAYLEERLLEAKRTNAELQIQRDYYKERYLEFNNAFIQGGEKMAKRGE